MAILKDLTANVLVNDQPCWEYDRDPECGWGSTKITRYIEAISGVQYKIHINASPSFEFPTGCLAFCVLLDGYRVSGQILARRHCGIGRTISQTPPSGQADSRRKSFFLLVKSSEVSQILRVMAENSLTFSSARPGPTWRIFPRRWSWTYWNDPRRSLPRLLSQKNTNGARL